MNITEANVKAAFSTRNTIENMLRPISQIDRYKVTNEMPGLSIELVGCAIAQAVSRWLPTAAARVRAPSGHVGFVVDEVALGQVFSEYCGSPCQSFHQILHPHNHPEQVQYANWWPTCRVDPV
jgi:hypothetical protein